VRKLPHWIGNALGMARLFLIAPLQSCSFQPAVR
jgi:magnesium-protoporphyrin IX monomethyl ester (oxidative) cyclase